jgi:hypothetical protein
MLLRRQVRLQILNEFRRPEFMGQLVFQSCDQPEKTRASGGIHQASLLFRPLPGAGGALIRTKAPVVSTMPMIHFEQWQRL